MPLPLPPSDVKGEILVGKSLEPLLDMDAGVEGLGRGVVDLEAPAVCDFTPLVVGGCDDELTLP